MDYPVVIERDGETWMASFPDIPEALTNGDSREEALQEAKDALLTAFEFYVEDNRPVPMPSVATEGHDVVAVPLSVWSKILLLNAMCGSGVDYDELARRLEHPPQEVRHLTDLRHDIDIDLLANALRALGRNVELIIR